MIEITDEIISILKTNRVYCYKAKEIALKLTNDDKIFFPGSVKDIENCFTTSTKGGTVFWFNDVEDNTHIVV